MPVIIDTNVAVVANGKSSQATRNCIDTCINRIEQIIQGEEILVLDDKWKILNEYLRNLRSRGEPGAGDRFLLWLLRNKDTLCQTVSITPINGSDNEFEEFPDDSALDDFDPDDRKFIAVACVHKENPPILQAVDSRWLDFEDQLHKNGVTVEFICEDDIQRLHRSI
ncbi:hypothetical protein JT359_01715 [Candidatus Poribacteria bacterium]|nr:hypothetical protein [Candidatus Poribacteria bacterium]